MSESAPYAVLGCQSLYVPSITRRRAGLLGLLEDLSKMALMLPNGGAEGVWWRAPFQSSPGALVRGFPDSEMSLLTANFLPPPSLSLVAVGPSHSG